MQVTLRRQQLRMARELADRFEVRPAAHQRRQEVVTERVEAARRQRVQLWTSLSALRTACREGVRPFAFSTTRAAGSFPRSA
jgi:hypothetical protein